MFPKKHIKRESTPWKFCINLYFIIIARSVGFLLFCVCFYWWEVICWIILFNRYHFPNHLIAFFKKKKVFFWQSLHCCFFKSFFFPMRIFECPESYSAIHLLSWGALPQEAPQAAHPRSPWAVFQEVRRHTLPSSCLGGGAFPVCSPPGLLLTNLHPSFRGTLGPWKGQCFLVAFAPEWV